MAKSFQGVYENAKFNIGSTFDKLWTRLVVIAGQWVPLEREWCRACNHAADNRFEQLYGDFGTAWYTALSDGAVVATTAPNGTRLIVARTMVGMVLLAEGEAGEYRSIVTGVFRHIPDLLNALEHMAIVEHDEPLDIPPTMAELYSLPRRPEFSNAGFKRDFLLASTVNATTNVCSVAPYAPVLLAHMRRKDTKFSIAWQEVVGDRADAVYKYIIE